MGTPLDRSTDHLWRYRRRLPLLVIGYASLLQQGAESVTIYTKQRVLQPHLLRGGMSKIILRASEEVPDRFVEQIAKVTFA